MKVLFVSEYFPPYTKGGGEMTAYKIAVELVKKGVDVDVLTSYFDKKEDNFKSLLPLKEFNLPINNPQEFGRCSYKDKEYCFMLLTWVDGLMAEKFLPDLSKEQQYNYKFKFSSMHVAQIMINERKIILNNKNINYKN